MTLSEGMGMTTEKDRGGRSLCVIGVLILALCLSVVSFVSVRGEEGDSTMAQPMDYFVKLIGTREGWPENMTPDEDRIMSEHYQYLLDLVAKKKVFLAGPVMDPVFGLVVLRTNSEQEAREIMDNEPSVVQGVHTYELHPMRVSLLVDHVSMDRYVENPGSRMLRKEVTVPTSLDSAWEAWTTTEGVKTFFASSAKVELRVGGPFEMYFNTDAPKGSQGSEDCHILSYLPMQMLSFEWNAPPSFGELRDKRTQVILMFDRVDAAHTKVTFTQLGWGEGEKWDELYAYFDKAWSYVLGNFSKRYTEGPVDWTEK